MKRKYSVGIFALSIVFLVSLAASGLAVGFGVCSVPSRPVSASVRADSLTAVSGADFPLELSLENAGKEAMTGGSVVLTVSREAQKGDFAAGNGFVVTRSIVKPSLDLPASSSQAFSFAWRVPASLPGGIYRIDASYVQGGRVHSGSSAGAGPFGGSAKVLVAGEATGTVYFIESNAGNDEPSIVLVNATGRGLRLPVNVRLYSGDISGIEVRNETKSVAVGANSALTLDYDISQAPAPFGLIAETSYKGVPAFYVFSPAPAGCPDGSGLPWWLMTIGSLGVAMLLMVLHRKERITL